MVHTPTHFVPRIQREEVSVREREGINRAFRPGEVKELVSFNRPQDDLQRV